MTAEQQGGTQPQDETTSPATASDQRAATAVADEPATPEPATTAPEPTEAPATQAASNGAAATTVPEPAEAPSGARGAEATANGPGLGEPAAESSRAAGAASETEDASAEAEAGAGGDESGAGGADELGDAASLAAKVDEAVSPAAPVADGEAVTAETEALAAAESPAATEAETAPTAQADTAVAPEAETAATPEAETVATPEAESAAPAAEPPAPPRDLGPEPTTMEELLSEQTGDIKSFKHGDVVEGSVVRIDKDEILVDIGAKSEGVVSNRELYGRNAESQPVLSIGDTVLVYVLQPESNEGHAVLSLRRAGLERKWRSMQEQFEAGVIIEAPVIDHNKGGLIVDCGIRGFVPISQIVDFPRRPQNDQPRDAAQEIAEKLQPFVGRRLRLKILEVNRKANRLILSEKVALYEERREKRDELFSSLQVGQRVKGTVRSIAPFGVFVDLGGIDGLVHKSELSWNKVNNPEAGYKVGEEVEAEVIDINHERGRISLSIRRLQPDPWHSTVADFKVGDIIDGTVTKIVNFGAFVRVRDGLEGLIHISELSHQRVAHPGDVVHEGQNLRLKIISLDSERHRLGLSLKQAEEPPARPAAEAPRERRPRQERSYDASQAVQEPEGGIDNTLAAAFAQVRQQMAETEQARAGAEPAGGDGAVPAATADEAEVAAQLTAATIDEDAPAAETDDAPALEVAPASEAAAETESTAEAAEQAPVADQAAEAEPATVAEEAETPTAGQAAEAEEASVAEEATATGAAAQPPEPEEPATTEEPAAGPAEAARPDEAVEVSASTDEGGARAQDAASTDEAAAATTSDESPPSEDVPARAGEDDKGSPVD